jgi:monofunctional biosynthetic peptidoglycan transglycosylase
MLWGLNIGRYAVWPPVGSLAERPPASSSFMEYRRDQWKAEGKEVKENWTWAEYSRISANLKRAVVIAEDDAFWMHHGFDWKGIREAMEKNLTRRSLDVGGSTITQQLAKNLYFSPRKSITRKLQEAMVVWRLERALSKERLLEIYLNVVEWGEGVYGAEAAARRYFKKSAANLTRHEAATLAAMLPNPLGRKPNSPVVRRLASIFERRMARPY